MIFSQPDSEESGFTVLSLFFFYPKRPHRESCTPGVEHHDRGAATPCWAEPRAAAEVV